MCLDIARRSVARRLVLILVGMIGKGDVSLRAQWQEERSSGQNLAIRDEAEYRQLVGDSRVQAVTVGLDLIC